MNIGEASRASAVSAKMIRYYEDAGLIPPAVRAESGYRAYARNGVHRLGFIRRARDLGFSVAEIGELLSLCSDRARQSADAKRLAQARIVELEKRIESRREMAETLQELVSYCAGDERPNCPILAKLEHPEEGDAKSQLQPSITSVFRSMASARK
jgi:MerR family transcriptional regulator, gold-responsive activator of gol and ges genes